VVLTQKIERLEIAFLHACRQDERLKGFQDTRPSTRVSEIQIELRLFGTIGILVVGPR
jgi:hypothetical protein